MISASEIKKLREQTGVGMMDCKKALVSTGGDFEAAIKKLREQGLAKAEKKAGRTAAEGLVEVVLDETGTKAALVEVNCETDFAAKNELFKKFTNELANTVLESQIGGDIEKLKQTKIFGTEKLVGEEVNRLIQVIGENIKIRRVLYSNEAEGLIGAYTHGSGKIVSIISVVGCQSQEIKDMAKNIAMHIVAAKPSFLNSQSVSEEVLKEERDIFKKQLEAEGKPEKIHDKIINGKIKKYYSENCLVEQTYVKDDTLNINQYVSQFKKDIEIKSFFRWELGEGIEVKSSNFSDEIKSLTR